MKYLTFGFDDCEIYDKRLAELFKKYNMKATFFLISDQLGFKCDFHRYGEDTVVERVSPKDVASVYDGMEVGCHTKNHKCTATDVNETVKQSCEYLSGLCKYTVDGFAYPGGHYSEDLKTALYNVGIQYARTIDCTHYFEVPSDFLLWNPTCKYDDADIFKLADEFINYKGNDDKIFYIYGHSYELTRKEENFNWSGFEKLLKKLSNKNDITYATNKEIFEVINDEKL